MADGKRPGGLTALAVINFVLGALSTIGLIVIFARLQELETLTGEELSSHPDAGLLWFSFLLAIVTIMLMIAAGVGYMGQKRFLGRKIGNGYALLSLVSVGIGVAVGEFEMTTLINIIYPLLTLVLLNTTFKDDLVN